MRMARVGVVGAVAAALAAGPAGAQTPVLRTNAAEIQIGGRVHTQFNTTSVEGEPDGEFLLRRARLEATVRINPVVSGRLQTEFGGDRLSVKDAYLKLDLHPAFQVLAGRAYRPFSLLEQTSSTRILPIERGLAIRGLSDRDQYEVVHDLAYADRDVGLQVMGAPAGAPVGLSYAAGVFAGPLAGRTGEEDTYQYAARATVRPLTGVTLGGAWSSRAFAEEVGPERFDIERGNAYELDVEMGSFAPGLHLMGELSFGDYDPFTDREFLGAQGWLAWRSGAVDELLSAVEPIFRASYSTIDGVGGDEGGTLLTPGVNLYFGGLNRVMFNYDFWSPLTGDAQGSFKTMFALAF